MSQNELNQLSNKELLVLMHGRLSTVIERQENMDQRLRHLELNNSLFEGKIKAFGLIVVGVMVPMATVITTGIINLLS